MNKHLLFPLEAIVSLTAVAGRLAIKANRRPSFRLLTLGIVATAMLLLMAGQGMAPAYAQEPGQGGGSPQSDDGGAEPQDVAIGIGDGWRITNEAPPAFTWTGPGTPFNNEGGFTFSNFLDDVEIKITDTQCSGDRFRVFDNGNLLGDTTVPVIGGPLCPPERHPDEHFADPDFSSGTFTVGPGIHRITIQAIQNPFSGGKGYIRVDEVVTLTCSVDIGSSFAGGQMTLDFSFFNGNPLLLGFNVWLVVGPNIIPIVSGAIIPPGTTNPPPVSFPFPSLGKVGWLAVLSSGNSIICADWELVDTGGGGSSTGGDLGEALQGARESLR